MKEATEFSPFSPRKENITYKVDDEYFTIIEKLDNGKTREVYWIEKSRCRTIEQQLDWLLQLNQKQWIDSYEFKDQFAAAIRLWKHNKMDLA
jgi:hypothetical protein